MTSTRDLKRRSSPAMLIVALVLAIAPIVRAQNVQRDGLPEGIRIHGHWVMQVLNADGTLAERREFDNALTSNGAGILSRVLTRTNGLARWTVELGASTGGPCAGGTYGPSPSTVIATNSCFITDRTATPPLAGTAVFATLTSGIGGPNNTQIVLSGNATAAVAGEIDYVATVQSLCANTIAGCNLPAINDRFTSHDLRDSQGVLTPVLVTAGQIVQVTVTISFCNSTGCPS
jgi:hypothetical protein